jgi:multimeric flavodoxin WrbA
MALKLLSIVATERKKGNSVLASMYIAKRLNAELEIVNLTKMEIKPCKACYRCLYGEDCKIEDDVESIFEKIDWADAVLIVSPVYWLDATGKLKALLDRCFMSIRYFKQFSGKRAVVLTPYGFEGMKGWASATHLVLARILGFDVLANIELRAALPAEIFTDKETFEKLNLAANLLEKGERAVLDHQCPVCMNIIFRIRDNNLECPVCGSLLNINMELVERGERFSQKWVVEHFSVELIGLKERYKELKDELKEAAKIAEHIG